MNTVSVVRWRRLGLVLGLAAVLAAAGGCQLARDLLPRTHTTALSPDGRYTAFVRQGLNPDPPDDHLYLGPTGGSYRRLMDLAPDSDWCRTIAWSADGRRVGFLIRDQRLAIFDAATAEHVAMLQLVTADGYPGSQGARNVTIGPGGVVSFERFDRTSSRSWGAETVTVPDCRLSLAIRWADSGALVTDAWVSVRIADGNDVSVRATPGLDGLVRLPAIAPGPFRAVHIGIRGIGAAVLLDVPVTERPLLVRLTKRTGRLVASSS